jgi:hypothetical protein
LGANISSDGTISSIIDKATKSNVLSGKGNEFAFYYDSRKHNISNCELTNFYWKKLEESIDLDMNAIAMIQTHR